MMTFPDSELPSDAARKVAALLDVIIELLCMGKPGESRELSAEALSGLAYVLMMARSQLGHLAGVVDHLEKEIDKLLDEAGVRSPAAKEPFEGIDGRLDALDERLKEAEERVKEAEGKVLGKQTPNRKDRLKCVQ